MVATANTGAVYLYILLPQTLVCIAVIVILAGTAGTVNTVLVNLNDFVALVPHPEKALTNMLSVVNAAALDAYLIRITLELFASPESTTTPEIPPIDVGNVHEYPVALVTAVNVYLYTLDPHTLLTKAWVNVDGAAGVVALTANIKTAMESQLTALVNILE